ncbi:MAG: T9SS type A sorting domain-containing protein [Candidatus Cloacimonadales bacterium]|nr:T9SS type A sorting domain-containing protein [Candidatus Cloacimonadales bacterium]
MSKKAKLKIMLILIIFVLFSFLHSQQTIIDTVYSIPELDGGIGYSINNGIYMVGNTDYGFHAGDWWGAIHGSIGYGRGFLTYPLPDIPENYSLNSATLFVFQHASFGNEESGEYPLFNLASGDVEPPCLIEHIDYGNYLDEGDFNLPALHPADTISTTPEQGWRSKEITDWVLDDIENNRSYTQSRLRLSLNYDTDYWMDLLNFKSADTLTEYKPFMIYVYIEDSSVDDENEFENLFSVLQIDVFPNPFNPETTIYYQILHPGIIKLQIFNIAGQLIDTLVDEYQNQGSHSVIWDASNQSSGIYFYRIKTGTQTATGKCLLLK